jgi:hypothetical protein
MGTYMQRGIWLYKMLSDWQDWPLMWFSLFPNDEWRIKAFVAIETCDALQEECDCLECQEANQPDTLVGV